MAAGPGGGGPPAPPDRGKQTETYMYVARDVGPYRVYVETKSDVKINKFSVGSLLRKVPKFKNSVIDLKYLGRNKIIVFFNCWMKANLLVGEKMLTDNGYSVYIPRHVLCITGVINGVPTEMEIEEIKEEIESSVQVIDVYRLSKWNKTENKKEPANRVSVTFRASNLPEKVKLFGCNVRVQTYVRKTILCENCHRYGHKTENCKSSKRCAKCSKVHDWNHDVCQNETKCLHCRTSDHRTTDTNCPSRMREKSIQNIMAKKNLTYIEAKELIAPMPLNNMYDLLANSEEFPTIQDSYAKKTSQQYTPKVNTQKQQQLKQQQQKQYQQKQQQQTQQQGTQQQQPQASTSKGRAGDKRIRTSDNEEIEMSDCGAGLNNPYATTEQERMQAIYNQGATEAYNKTISEMRGDLMNFYSALIQSPEISESVQNHIKECSKRFLRLDSILN